jgi:hypothetical protein
MLADGMIAACIRSTVELDGVSQRLEKLHNGGLRGKAVIRLSKPSAIVTPTSRSARTEVRPKVSRDSLLGGMELQTVTLRYKRGPRQGCICHDDLYAVSSLENDPMKILGRVKVGQPGTVEREAR